MHRSPTGQQHELRHGNQSAVVVEVGGGLREYVVGGRAVIDGYEASAAVDGGRGQVLVPWPNRVGDGRYQWGEPDSRREHQLAITEVPAHNAIHGLLRWSAWRLVDRDDARVVLAANVWPQPGYPFQLDVQITYALGPDGLAVSIAAENAGHEPAPYGVGQHPYLTVGTSLVDEALLTVPARQWIRTDDRGLPVSTEAVDGTPYDFRDGRAIADLRLDTAYTDLDRDGAGNVVVRLAHPTRDHGVDVWMGSAAAYLQVFTGDTLAADRRRRSLAVEPMSCPADAFRSRTGLVALGPGDRHELTWGLRPW